MDQNSQNNKHRAVVSRLLTWKHRKDFNTELTELSQQSAQIKTQINHRLEETSPIRGQANSKKKIEISAQSEIFRQHQVYSKTRRQGITTEYQVKYLVRKQPA